MVVKEMGKRRAGRVSRERGFGGRKEGRRGVR